LLQLWSGRHPRVRRGNILGKLWKPYIVIKPFQHRKRNIWDATLTPNLHNTAISADGVRRFQKLHLGQRRVRTRWQMNMQGWWHEDYRGKPPKRGENAVHHELDIKSPGKGRLGCGVACNASKSSLTCLIRSQAMKTCGGDEVCLHISLIQHWMEVCGQVQSPPALSLVEESTSCIGYEAGWAPEPVWTIWWMVKSLAPNGNRTPH
jgi:hypothetical protein